MTDTEYKAELETELALLNTAIKHIIKTGERYEVGTGSSKRIFEADLGKYRKMRNEIRLELKQYGDNAGIVVGGAW